MKDVSISIGDILTIDQKNYRVLYLQEDRISLIELDSTKLNIFYASIKDLSSRILKEEILVFPDKEDTQIIQTENLPEYIGNQLALWKSVMSDVEKEYGPSYVALSVKGPKPEINEIMERHGIKKTAFWRRVRLYLQSGFKQNSLLDHRAQGFFKEKKEYHYEKKPGRAPRSGIVNRVVLDNTLRERFTEALNDFKSGRAKTYAGAFEDMLCKYYTQETLNENGVMSIQFLPDEELPTYRQFYNFASKNISRQELDKIKTSAAEVRNNKRLLLSDSLKGVYGPGDLVEIDAMETDVFLVSESNREKTIGRAVLYLMIDVWSRAIIAISVALDNNSILGLTNLFLNLADDKAEYAKKFGLENINSDLWPSGILPRRIRVDRGADFKSNRLSEILNELGIERLLVTGASGSLKGVVEQQFRQLQYNLNDIVENDGYISKRKDSTHKKNAVLTINEFTKICINYVLMHNQAYQQYYKLSKKMMDEKVEPVPIKLWDYGCKKFGSPRPIPQKAQYLWSLLTPAKASLNREGIKWKGLYYLNTEDSELMNEMYELQKKVKKIDIRFDPRDIGKIYYLRDSHVLTARLNPDKFGNLSYDGLTYQEYNQYLKQKSEMDAAGKRKNTRLKSAQRAINKHILDSSPTDHHTDSENLIESRFNERNRVNKENSISKRLEENEEQANTFNLKRTKSSSKAPQTSKPQKISEENRAGSKAVTEKPTERTLEDLDFADALEMFDNKDW